MVSNRSIISFCTVLWSSLSVPTVDTTRTNWLLEQMVKVKRPVVLVGESGTSKTATTQNFLNSLNPDTTVSPAYVFLPTVFPECQTLTCEAWFMYSRRFWPSISHQEPHPWTYRGTWRPALRRERRRHTDLPWERDCWCLWTTLTCHEYVYKCKRNVYKQDLNICLKPYPDL